MKKIIAIVVLFFLAFDNYSGAQSEEVNKLFQEFLKTYTSGDLIHSNEILLSIVYSKPDLPSEYRGLMYNNLSAVNTMMGRYEDALEYSKKAEATMLKEQQESTVFAEIYINRAYINTVQKAYGSAIEYLEKAIRIFDNLNETDKQKFSQNISAAYLNIGIAYYEIGNFKAASNFLTKSSSLKVKV